MKDKHIQTNQRRHIGIVESCRNVALRESLDPDFELYQAEVLELRVIAQSIESSLAVARLTAQSWEKGHQSFVDGKESRFWYYTSFLLNYAVEKAKMSVL